MVSQICKFVDTESKIEVTKSQGRGNYCLTGTEFLLGWKKALGIDSGDSYTTLWMYFLSLN